MGHSSAYNNEKIEVSLKRHIELELNIDNKKKIVVNLLDSDNDTYELEFQNFTDNKESYFAVVKLAANQAPEFELKNQCSEDVKNLLLAYMNKVQSYLQQSYFDSKELTGWKKLKLFEDKLQ